MSAVLLTDKLPYCPGCTHHHVTRQTAKALEKLGYTPFDVVLVTDIGCHGIADAVFATHTVHGLHGRSTALGCGIAMGLPPGKKVIVFIGDGGATIGLQHILEAARMNIPLTVVVHNNFLYGMTGGQPSGLTPPDFKTVIAPEGTHLPHHNLCELVHQAGAAFAARVVGLGDFSSTLAEAFAQDGFSLVEVLEMCTSYTPKFNPDFKLREVAQAAGYALGSWKNEPRPAYRPNFQQQRPSLLAQLKRVERQAGATLSGRVGIILAGSAGEGVQYAAESFARAAVAGGLHATKKGSYPVTVGVGFSAAEILLDPEPIRYHGITQPDLVIITSEDGLHWSRPLWSGMTAGQVYLDASLPRPEVRVPVEVRDFRTPHGAKNAALFALAVVARELQLLPAALIARFDPAAQKSQD
ncbi:MAG: thiamine pyrophosphate-dependent enzyme [Thermoanaerobaculum sp.]|nr:thiamine pyrophosphate-dependent enzyme [Thermoanaerobaculum sp.]MDW7966979.1 thiamine pyrophosphate-dependent enzyme [Thermoanaerobaculum sp.]